jgi:1,4-dihydroxy-2-naphthoate octaprenyltransferase
MRDIEHDRAAGKTTLATILGRRRAATEYLLWIVVSYLAVLLTILVDRVLWPVLLVLVTVLTAIRLIELARTGADAASLNRLLRKTAGLHLRFGSLLVAGLLIRAALDRL